MKGPLFFVFVQTFKFGAVWYQLLFFQSFTLFKPFTRKIPHDIPEIVITEGNVQLNLDKPTEIEVQNSAVSIFKVKVSVVGKRIHAYSQF